MYLLKTHDKLVLTATARHEKGKLKKTRLDGSLTQAFREKIQRTLIKQIRRIKKIFLTIGQLQQCNPAMLGF
jgi:hypothetical protein